MKSFVAFILQQAQNMGCRNQMQKVDTMAKETDKPIPVAVGKK